MAKKAPLSHEEAAELFSHLNEQGLVDPTVEGTDRLDRERARQESVDPLSNQDPSGSKTGDAISKTALFSIILVLVIVVGTQVGYGVLRRLNTANLSETVNTETVELALKSGVEWGNGFTQFPAEFTVDEASESTGVIEVSVVDTESTNELELLTNAQIQASALATNALLNDKIERVIYNVYALVDEDGNIQYDRFFGLVSASGTRQAMLSFIWTKSGSDDSSTIAWELQIIGLDEVTTDAIQEQVNSVSSIVNDSTASQSELDAEQDERLLELSTHDEGIYMGPAAGDDEEEDESSLVEELAESLADDGGVDDADAGEGAEGAADAEASSVEELDSAG